MKKIIQFLLGIIVFVIFLIIYLISCFIIIVFSKINTTLSMLFFNLFINIIIANFYKLNKVVRDFEYVNKAVIKSEKQKNFETNLTMFSYIIMFFLLVVPKSVFQEKDLIQMKSEILLYVSQNTQEVIFGGLFLFILLTTIAIFLSNWSYRVVLSDEKYYVTIRTDEYLLENKRIISNYYNKKACPPRFRKKLNKK